MQMHATEIKEVQSAIQFSEWATRFTDFGIEHVIIIVLLHNAFVPRAILIFNSLYYLFFVLMPTRVVVFLEKSLPRHEIPLPIQAHLHEISEAWEYESKVFA